MASVDYFLKVDGIDGESGDHKHKNEIHVLSWDWSEHQAGTMAFGGGGGAGKVQMGDFNFTMQFNKASPKLMLACASGAHIKKATLICRKAGKDQQEYLKIVFSDLLVSNYRTGGSAHGDQLPTDSISMNYTKIEVEYKPQKSDGSLDGPVAFNWNVKENKGA